MILSGSIVKILIDYRVRNDFCLGNSTDGFE